MVRFYEHSEVMYFSDLALLYGRLAVNTGDAIQRQVRLLRESSAFCDAR